MSELRIEAHLLLARAAAGRHGQRHRVAHARVRQSVAAGREALEPGRRPLLLLAQLLQHRLGQLDLRRGLGSLCAHVSTCHDQQCYCMHCIPRCKTSFGISRNRRRADACIYQP